MIVILGAVALLLLVALIAAALYFIHGLQKEMGRLKIDPAMRNRWKKDKQPEQEQMQSANDNPDTSELIKPPFVDTTATV